MREFVVPSRGKIIADVRRPNSSVNLTVRSDDRRNTNKMVIMCDDAACACDVRAVLRCVTILMQNNNNQKPIFGP